jgi:hypothetical protein
VTKSNLEDLSTDDNVRSRSFLATFRDISFVLTIYLYVLGFTYYYYFLTLIGLPVNLTDIPIYQFIGYAYIVLTYYGLVIVIAMIAMIVFGIAWICIRKQVDRNCRIRQTLRLWRQEVAVVTALLLFILTFGLSDSAAVGQMKCATQTGAFPRYLIRPPGFEVPSKRIRFTEQKGGSSQEPPYLAVANHAGSFFFLGETKEVYLVMILRPLSDISKRSVLSRYYGNVVSFSKASVSNYWVESYAQDNVSCR